MSKMGSHGSFGHLKHKLWAKERPGVKLTVWLPTTKSRESTQCTWLQTTCHIPLESSQRELQLCFRLHFDPRSARKVMGLQSLGSPRWRDFGTPTRESQESPLARFRDSHVGVSGEKSHLDAGLVERHKVYYKGEGGGFPRTFGCQKVWVTSSLAHMRAHSKCWKRNFPTLTNWNYWKILRFILCFMFHFWSRSPVMPQGLIESTIQGPFRTWFIMNRNLKWRPCSSQGN